MKPFPNNRNVSIRRYTTKDRQPLLLIWERSVASTHHFLSPEDFADIKTLVHRIDFAAFDLYCLVKGNEVAGFVGIVQKKVEMLFIDPKHFGLGGGKQLMEFAIEQCGVNSVDVNEQNVGAVAFYKKLGFEVGERTEKDDQGRDYPLLRMKRQPR